MENYQRLEKLMNFILFFLAQKREREKRIDIKPTAIVPHLLYHG